MCSCHNTGARSVSTTYRWICFLWQISLQRRAPAGSSELHSSDWDDRPLSSTRTSFRGHLILDRKTKTPNTFHFNGNETPGLCVKAVTFAYCFSIFYYVYSMSSNLYGPLLILVMVQETICLPNTFCSWNLKTLFFISAFNMIILRILEWYLENLALADVMNTHAAFLFMWLNHRTNQRLCFNCGNYELVWNGNKHGVVELGNPWVVHCLSDL